MGGVVKGAFNVVKSVVKYGVNMVKSVIKNPLPTIATIALGVYAPQFASFSGLTKAFGQATGELIVNGVGRAAISAANGGKLSSIVAAGITPFFNSPIFNDFVGGLGGGIVGESLNVILFARMAQRCSENSDKFLTTSLTTQYIGFRDKLVANFTRAVQSVIGQMGQYFSDDLKKCKFLVLVLVFQF